MYRYPQSASLTVIACMLTNPVVIADHDLRVNISNSVSDSQFSSAANFPAAGTFLDYDIDDNMREVKPWFIKVQTFDTDYISLVSSVIADWDGVDGDWETVDVGWAYTGESLRAPNGTPLDLIEDFEIEACATDGSMFPMSNIDIKTLKVKGPAMP